jgi:hypothetical protein
VGRGRDPARHPARHLGGGQDAAGRDLHPAARQRGGCHSDKEGAEANFKGFGLHPLLAYCDNTGEPLAGMLRPGSSGSAPLDARLPEVLRNLKVQR